MGHRAVPEIHSLMRKCCNLLKAIHSFVCTHLQEQNQHWLPSGSQLLSTGTHEMYYIQNL